MPAKKAAKASAKHCEANNEASDANPLASTLWKLLKKDDYRAIEELLFDEPTNESGEAHRRVKQDAREAVNKGNKEGLSPLLYAVQNSAMPETIAALLEAGADPNRMGQKGDKQTPLIAACWGEDDVLALELLGKGAKLETLDGKGNNCLHICARVGFSAMAEEIMKSFVSSESQLATLFLACNTELERTPLHYAFEELAGEDHTHGDIVEVLMSALGLSTSRAAKYALPLETALKVLLIKDKNGSTALHLLGEAMGSAPHMAPRAAQVYEAVFMAYKDKDDALRQLLTARDEEGRSPLQTLLEHNRGSALADAMVAPLRALSKPDLIADGLLQPDNDGNGALASALLARGVSSVTNLISLLPNGCMNKSAVESLVKAALLKDGEAGAAKLIEVAAAAIAEGIDCQDVTERAKAECAEKKREAEVAAAAEASAEAEEQGDYGGISATGERVPSLQERARAAALAAKKRHRGDGQPEDFSNEKAPTSGLGYGAIFLVFMLMLGFLLPVLDWMFPAK